MTATTYHIHPISPADAEALRARGGEEYVADAKPGFPCRQCLRDAEVGEQMILVSHDPFALDSPYRSASPIFLHREVCSTLEPLDAPPLQMTRRQLAVRAFDDRQMMIDAAVIDGVDLDATIQRLLIDDTAERLQVHFAARGCWAATVTRSESGSE